MKFLSSILIAMALQVQFTFAQVGNVYGSAGTVLREKGYEVFEGSPYLYENWVVGKVIDKQGEEFDKISLNYDSYKDQILIIKESSRLMLDQNHFVAFEVTKIDNQLIEPMRFKNGFQFGTFTYKNYFEVLYDGKTKFLKKITTDLVDNTIPGYGTNEIKKKFSTSFTYYVLLEDMKYIELKKNRSNLYGLLENEKVISNYVKDHNLNLRDDNDLILLLKEYDQSKFN